MARPRSLATTLAAFGVLLAPLAPGRAPAQQPSDLQVLVEPSARSGSCIGAPGGGVGEASGIRQLVITSRQPEGRRTIRLITRSDASVVGYADQVDRFDARRGGSGESIVARLDSTGRWSGMRQRVLTSLATTTLDTIGAVAIPRPVTEMAPPATLTRAEVRRVGEMAEWMQRRCPA